MSTPASAARSPTHSAALAAKLALPHGTILTGTQPVRCSLPANRTAAQRLQQPGKFNHGSWTPPEAQREPMHPVTSLQLGNPAALSQGPPSIQEPMGTREHAFCLPGGHCTGHPGVLAWRHPCLAGPNWAVVDPAVRQPQGSRVVWVSRLSCRPWGGTTRGGRLLLLDTNHWWPLGAAGRGGQECPPASGKSRPWLRHQGVGSSHTVATWWLPPQRVGDGAHPGLGMWLEATSGYVSAAAWQLPAQKMGTGLCICVIAAASSSGYGASTSGGSSSSSMAPHWRAPSGTLLYSSSCSSVSGSRISSSVDSSRCHSC
jgi:hypothetical protein